MKFSFIVTIFLLSSTTLLAHPGFGWGGPFGGGSFGLFAEFYQFSCPQANDTVMSVLRKAIAKDPRMAASLLRLHSFIHSSSSSPSAPPPPRFTQSVTFSLKFSYHMALNKFISTVLLY